MAATVPSINTFSGVAPPWSLAQLDANFANISTILGSVNTYTQYAADTGSANAYVISFGAGVVTTFAAGLGVVVRAATSNTGASTLNVGATGVKPLLRSDGTALQGGEIVAGGLFTAISDGTSYFLQSVVLPISGTVNGLVNGGFEIWQYGTSVAVAASANGYTADRWAMTTNASQSHTMSQQTGTISGSQFSIRVQRDAGQTGVGAPVFEQPFELAEIVKYRGQKISVSFIAQTGANWSPASGAFTVIIAAGTGAAARRGTAAYTSETVVLTQTQALAASGGPTAYTATSSVVVPTNTTQMTLYFTWTPVGTAGANDWIQLDDVMWSVGLASAPFERRLIQKEIALCQRYFCKSFALATAPAQNTGITAGSATYRVVVGGVLATRVACSFPVTMRIIPTLIFYNPSAANANWRNSSVAADSGATTSGTVGESSFSINNTQVAGDLAGNNMQVNWSASAEL